MFAFLQPPGGKPNRVSHQKKYPHRIKTDRIDPTDGLNVDDVGKLEKLKNLNIKVFEKVEEKFLSQLYVSKNMNKNEDNNEDSLEGTIDALLIMNMKAVFNSVKIHLIQVCIKVIIFQAKRYMHFQNDRHRYNTSFFVEMV